MKFYFYLFISILDKNTKMLHVVFIKKGHQYIRGSTRFQKLRLFSFVNVEAYHPQFAKSLLHCHFIPKYPQSIPRFPRICFASQFQSNTILLRIAIVVLRDLPIFGPKRSCSSGHSVCYGISTELVQVRSKRTLFLCL